MQFNHLKRREFITLLGGVAVARPRRDRMLAKLRRVNRRCGGACTPNSQQGKWLGHVARGYFNYHAVPINFRSLAVFRVEATKRWRRVLSQAISRIHT
jgi:hypothetical protein